MEDIVATLRVETRRVAVRSTDWLDVSGPLSPGLATLNVPVHGSLTGSISSAGTFARLICAIWPSAVWLSCPRSGATGSSLTSYRT